MIVYGIPNCDTVAKTRRWLTANDVDFTFQNFKKDGIDKATIASWLNTIEWSALLNKRGTTYRKLSDEQKALLEEQNIELLIEYPSLMKRPVITFDKHVLLGFKEGVIALLEQEVK